MSELRDLLYRLADIRLERLAEVNVESWLRLNALRYIESRGKGQKVLFRNRRISDDELKRALLSEIFEAYRCESPDLRSILERASSLMDAVKESLKGLGYSTIDITVETRSKLLIGVSEEVFGRPIFEVGLTWDPLLNLPYIPGSSLKGAFRSYLSLRGVKVGGLEVNDLLGDSAHASYVVFADSYPVYCRDHLIVPDVMTPIYREAEGRIRETEARPTPIVYPVVAEGVRFSVIVGVNVRGGQGADRERLEAIRSELTNFLLDAMRQGIGAKTMLGYGALEVSKISQND